MPHTVPKRPTNLTMRVLYILLGSVFVLLATYFTDFD